MYHKYILLGPKTKLFDRIYCKGSNLCAILSFLVEMLAMDSLSSSDMPSLVV